MCFHFDDTMRGQREYSLQASCRMERWKRKEKVRHPISVRHQDSGHFPENAISHRLFAGFVGEMLPHHAAGRQKASKKNVGGQMHMMMTIEPCRFCTVETMKLIALRGYQVFEGTYKQRMKNAPRPRRSQMSGDVLLALPESSRTCHRGKRSGEVKVQPGIDTAFAGDRCGPLRILHPHHGAY